jgi:hypothetical protein
MPDPEIAVQPDLSQSAMSPWHRSYSKLGKESEIEGKERVLEPGPPSFRYGNLLSEVLSLRFESFLRVCGGRRKHIKQNQPGQKGKAQMAWTPYCF